MFGGEIYLISDANTLSDPSLKKIQDRKNIFISIASIENDFLQQCKTLFKSHVTVLSTQEYSTE